MYCGYWRPALQVSAGDVHFLSPPQSIDVAEEGNIVTPGPLRIFLLERQPAKHRTTRITTLSTKILVINGIFIARQHFFLSGRPQCMILHTDAPNISNTCAGRSETRD